MIRFQRCLFGTLVLFLPLLVASNAAAAGWNDDDSKVDARRPTHKQVRSIRPTLDGKLIPLNTFCTAHDGNLIACVGGDEVSYAEDEDGNYLPEKTEHPEPVQWYSPKLFEL